MNCKLYHLDLPVTVPGLSILDSLFEESLYATSYTVPFGWATPQVTDISVSSSSSERLLDLALLPNGEEEYCMLR